VKDAIRHQTPILTRSPNTDAAEDIEDIAQYVLRELARGRQQAEAAASA
jgi:flagellar biosynthesis protein FlhG